MSYAGWYFNYSLGQCTGSTSEPGKKCHICFNIQYIMALQMSQIYPGAISNYYIFIPGVLLPRVDTKFKSPVRMFFFGQREGEEQALQQV